jgi:hypothetical protein
MLAMTVDTSDFDRQLRKLAEMPDIIRKVVVGAMSETIDDLVVRQQMEMEEVFNNPTPYIKKGIKGFYPGGNGPVRGFKKGRTGANVTQAGTYFEFFPMGSSPEDIVKPHVFGGKRRFKRSEQRLVGVGGVLAGTWTAMGKNYPRNKSGDINGARYTQMLHQLGAISDMARQSMGKGRQSNRKGVSFFPMVPKGGKRGDSPFAIAERRGNQLTIMLVTTRKEPGYRKKYDYFGVGEKQVAYSLPIHFNRVLQRYMSRL